MALDKYWNYVPQYYLKHNLILPSEILPVILLLFFVQLSLFTYFSSPSAHVQYTSIPFLCHYQWEPLFASTYSYCYCVHIFTVVGSWCVRGNWSGVHHIPFDSLFNSLEQRFYTHRLDGKYTPISHRYYLVEKKCIGSTSYRILYIYIRIRRNT